MTATLVVGGFSAGQGTKMEDTDDEATNADKFRFIFFFGVFRAINHN